MPIHRRPKFSAVTQVVMQPRAEEGPPRGTGSQNSPPLLPNESAEPGESPLLGLVLTLIAPRAGAGGAVSRVSTFSESVRANWSA